MGFIILVITWIIIGLISSKLKSAFLNGIFFVGFITIIFLIVLFLIAPTHMVEVETDKIVSVQDNRGIHGNRYALHSGQDITILVDYNNYKKIKNIDSSIIDIIETDKEKPSLIRVESRYNSNLLNKIYGDQNIATKRIYKLYIPKGTLVEDYNIDLK